MLHKITFVYLRGVFNKFNIIIIIPALEVISRDHVAAMGVWEGFTVKFCI